MSGDLLLLVHVGLAKKKWCACCDCLLYIGETWSSLNPWIWKEANKFVGRVCCFQCDPAKRCYRCLTGDLMCTMNMPCVQGIFIHLHVYHRYIISIYLCIYLRSNYYLKKSNARVNRATHTISESCWNVGSVQLVAQSWNTLQGTNIIPPWEKENHLQKWFVDIFWRDLLVLRRGVPFWKWKNDWSQIDKCLVHLGTCWRWCWNLKVP